MDKKVADFYDEFWVEMQKQSMAGINSRHRRILKKLKDAGMKSNASLLEIGSGVGTLSSFLASNLNSGRVDAVDISPASVEFSKKKYANKKNLHFYVSDMSDFQIDRTFDVILFPDVLEHIPVEAHENIFKTIRQLVHKNSLVAINLPDPRSLRWFHKNNPEVLQIIDQDIEANVIINHFYNLGFYLHTFETYNLYMDKPDYNWFVFKLQDEYDSLTRRPQFLVLLNGLKLRILNLFS